MASEFVEGEDIKIDDVAEVGVLGTVDTRFIILFFSFFAEFQTCYCICPGFLVSSQLLSRFDHLIGVKIGTI